MRFRVLGPFLTSLLGMFGCGQTTDEPAPSSVQAPSSEIPLHFAGVDIPSTRVEVRALYANGTVREVGRDQ